MRPLRIRIFVIVPWLAFTAAAELPTPVQLRHLDLSAYAGPNDFYRGNLQWGDLDNDGLHHDFIRYANSRRMQAFAFDGATPSLLWDYTAPVPLPDPPNKYHYKYVIWDIDADGRREVIGPFASSSGVIELRVVDGATGVVERSVPTAMPNPTSDDDILEWRIYVTVANFRGLPSARDIVLLNEYESDGDIWVFDDQLGLLWDTTGDNAAKQRIYAHFPYTGDVDGDGRDELVGTWLFDDDGTKLWRLTPPDWEPFDYYYDHPDRAFIGDLDDGRSGAQSDAEILISHEYKRGKLYDGAGNLYWETSNDGRDAKIVAVGDVTSEHPEHEIVVWDDRYKSETHIFDVDGGDVRTMDHRVFDGYPIDWDGDRSVDEIFSPNDHGHLYAPWSDERIFVNAFVPWNTPPGTGYRVFASVLDLVGDYREEIVVMDEDEIFVFGAAGPAPASHPSPWTDDRYRLMIANKQDDIHPERSFYDWREVPVPGPIPVPALGAGPRALLALGVLAAGVALRRR